MDRTGHVIIHPQFDDEGDFFGGLAKVRISDHWCYIDEKGRLAIPCIYDAAGDFHEGLAPVQIQRKWGFVNTAGKLAIQPQFQAAAEFHDGLAQFEVWSTINCPAPFPGKGTTRYTSENAPRYAYHLYDVPPLVVGGCVPVDDRYGFVGKDGRVAIAPRFVHAGNFSEGRAYVRLSTGLALLGYIDTSGAMVIPPKFRQALSFSEGLAAVEMGPPGGDGNQQRWGFIERDGALRISAVFRDARPFSNDRAAVLLRHGQWGYIAGDGALAILAQYRDASTFSEGLALVVGDDDESYYYIDQNGQPALRLSLAMWPFSDGLTIAGMVGKQQYFDRHGRAVAYYESDIEPR